MRFWKTCQNAIKTNTIPSHGNTNNAKKSRKFDETVSDDLHLFFEELKLFAEPMPTKKVRELTGSVLRDDDKDNVRRKKG